MTEPRSGLKRALKLRDLILLNIVAVYTPNTLAQNMPLGKLGLLVWALAIAGFMLPYAAAIAGLSRCHPREGGVYAWTRMALGDFHGFLCGWCYWVNTFLYVPSVFLGIAAVLALLGGDAKVGSRDVVNLLYDTNKDVSDWAKLALPKVNPPLAGPVFTLLNSKDEEARLQAIAELAKMKGAAAPAIPQALLKQLKPGGRLIAPVGPAHGDQSLVLVAKQSDGSARERAVLPVAFVPLVGAPPPGTDS